jgi:hypothetical protein
VAAQEKALPPMPDPVSGQPRPPNAPVYGRVPDEADGSGGKAPSPPRGSSPTLEWHVETGAKHVKAALFGGAVMIAVFFVAAGTDWVGYWWMWLAVVGVALILYFGMRGRFMRRGRIGCVRSMVG